MPSARRQYPFHLIEPKWQQHWEKQETFRAWNPGEAIPEAHPFARRHGKNKADAATLPPKYYILDMFPYPSGAGLHVGHPEGYTATDILARYQRAQGFHVLHPMGWDAFGLPAEQYAIKTGQHPRQTTEENVATFKRQIKSLGFSYDWNREINTTDPNYFKWTQWIFLKIYNSWFNPKTNKAEPIETLSYPLEAGNEEAKRAYRDSKRLAYVSEAPVNWCPELGTVLANEEVIDGKSEVGGFPVIRRPMRQWMLRITAYAERLLNDLDTIDWSHSLKEMQRNWIGRSEGAEVDFQVEGRAAKIRVFTTRPDTLFGATYMVLAPEHPLVQPKPEGIVPSEWPENCPWLFTSKDPREVVSAYKQIATTKSELERTELSKSKSGVFSGAYAINPVDRKSIPIWIADYVLATYGTGAIMAVPAHDDRDFEFALEHDLPIKVVVEPSREWLTKHFNPLAYVGITSSELRTVTLNDESKRSELAMQVAQKTGDSVNHCEECVRLLQRLTSGADASSDDLAKLRECYQLSPWCFVDETTPTAFTAEGTAMDSANADFSLNGLRTTEAKEKITIWLEAKGLGKRTINYKLRDWLFSRQRYWGEPFPIIWKGAHHEAVPESALPVLPPDLTDFKPTESGEPPLARAKDWVNLPDGSKRETNTMPQWAGSCWYYLRYLDAQNDAGLFSQQAEGYWMGIVSVKSLNGEEVKSPDAASSDLTFQRFNVSTNPGVDLYVGGTEHAVLHLLYARFWHKVLYDLGHVSTSEPFFKLVNQGMILGEDGQKMSKARDNVVNPDDMVAAFGADAFRLYEMFMGPLEMVKPWSTKGVEGVYRFLGRVWRLFVDEKSETDFEQSLTTQPDKGAELLQKIQLHPAIKKVDPTSAQLKALHACIKKVTEDLEGMRFNTAISALMVFVNEAMTWEARPQSVLHDFLILLQPFAPHLAEELFAKLEQAQTADRGPQIPLAYAPWPKFNPALLVEETLEIAVQVNGKLRDVIVFPASATQQEIEAAALAAEKVQPFLAGKSVKKIIFVPRRLVNIAVA